MSLQRIAAIVLPLIIAFLFSPAAHAADPKPIPDKLIVLTFDDANASDYHTVAPILKQHGFNATFYVTSGWVGSEKRLTWDDVRKLHELGFEIGNHSVTHPNFLDRSEDQFRAEVTGFDQACIQHGILKATSFGYPGSHFDRRMVRVLNELGYTTARRGSDPEAQWSDDGGIGIAYEPGLDDPFLVPGAFTRGSGFADSQGLLDAINMANNGKISVLIYHGVPDLFPHCSTSVERFKADMQMLKDQGCTVISMRDLSSYVDLTKRPRDIYAPIINRRGGFAVNPETNAKRNPSFSWTFASRKTNHSQVAYQILVASSKQKLERDEGDLWDTGKVNSVESKNIAYRGKRLEKNNDYWWKVRLWNQPDQKELDRVSKWIAAELISTMRKSLPGPYSQPVKLELN